MTKYLKNLDIVIILHILMVVLVILYKALKLVSESNYKLAFTMWPTSIKYAKSNYLIPRISGNNHIDLKYEIYKSFISHKHYVNGIKIYLIIKYNMK